MVAMCYFGFILIIAIARNKAPIFKNCNNGPDKWCETPSDIPQTNLTIIIKKERKTYRPSKSLSKIILEKNFQIGQFWSRKQEKTRIRIRLFCVSAGGGDSILSCLELFNPDGIDNVCCENLESFGDMSKGYEECLNDTSEEWLCEEFKCILNKTGAMKDDEINEDGAMKFYEKLEKDYPKEKSLIERVRQECLAGKYLTYPPEDGCPAVRFYVCTYINTFYECDSWKKLEVCTEMAENAKKCKRALEDMIED